MKCKRYRFDEVTVNFDRKRIPLSSKQRAERRGNYRYYGAQGVIDYVDDYIFDGTYLLIAEDGENLKSQKQNIAQIVKGKFWVNNHAHIIQTNELCDLRYLYYLINRMDLSGYITGSAQPKLSQANLNAVVLELPSIEEQKRIVSILGVLDDKVELNNKINDNLEQQAEALFKAWFFDYLPFGGEMPQEWTESTIEELTSLVSRGIAPKYTEDSDQVIINQKCIRDHRIDLSLARTHTPKKINEKWLQFGDLLINSTGEGTLGRTAQVWFNPEKMTVDSHVTIVRPKSKELIYYIGFWGLLHEREIESLHTGSTGQTELPRERIKAMELVLPDQATLAKFNAIVQPMTETIINNQIQNNKLAALRDALLPKLMAGEIDIWNH